MSNTTPNTSERTRISCPGCGRHDFVSWPAGQPTMTWTCFNCHKTSVLTASGKH